MINFIKIFTQLLFGLSILVVSSPTLGEMIATMAPLYPLNDEKLVSRLGIPYQAVSFPSSDGITLQGWYFPSEEVGSPAIVYAPATSHDQRSGISLVEPLLQAGYNVLLFSYRGHGRSEGNRFGFTYGAYESEDIDAAVTFLTETKGIEKIGLIGHSAGAASGIISAARNSRIDAVIAAAPFSTVEEIWNTNRPSFFPEPLFELTFKFAEYRKQFSRNQVRPKDVIDLISPRPLLLIHGVDDKRITNRQAMELFDAANEPKSMWLVEGASHAQVRAPVLDSQIQNIISFFDQALKIAASPSRGIEHKGL